jgi:hypothetical protein
MIGESAGPADQYSDQQSVFLGSVEVQMRYGPRAYQRRFDLFPDLRTIHTGPGRVGQRSQGTTLTPLMDYAAGDGGGKEWWRRSTTS